jgi:hypothetical protein
LPDEKYLFPLRFYPVCPRRFLSRQQLAGLILQHGSISSEPVKNFLKVNFRDLSSRKKHVKKTGAVRACFE